MWLDVAGFGPGAVVFWSLLDGPCLPLEQSTPFFPACSVCSSCANCTAQMCVTCSLEALSLTCCCLYLEHSSSPSYLDKSGMLSWFLLSYPFLQTAGPHVSSNPLQAHTICTIEYVLYFPLVCSSYTVKHCQSAFSFSCLYLQIDSKFPRGGGEK